uniref:Uncharacterized protein n=1 Tax=Siphoviridae sp. ctD6g5 TaxID=2826196 RepID=A0A8S5MRT2_9CAUD|nr:MAG TPA: hypothetical protein [Siphoviridae sp. ctD6g5]
MTHKHLFCIIQYERLFLHSLLCVPPITKGWCLCHKE